MTVYRNALNQFEECKDLFDEYKEMGYLHSAADEYCAAAERGHYNIVRAFIKIFGGDYVDTASERSMTAFHRAISHRHYKTAQFLLDHGANIDVVGFFSFNKTPFLMEQCDIFLNRSYNEKTLIFLIENGADIHLQDKNGESAYTMIVKSGKKDMIDFFENPHAPRPPFDIEMKEVLDACMNGHKKKVEAFVKKFGIGHLEKKTSQGKNGLLIAAQHRRRSVIEYLLAEGADVNVKNLKGDPVSKLCIRSPWLFSMILQNKKLNINATDAEGNTLLMNALLMQQTHALEEVWAKNPRLNIRNEEGFCFRQLADQALENPYTISDIRKIVKPYTTRAGRERLITDFNQGVGKDTARVKKVRLRKPPAKKDRGL